MRISQTQGPLSIRDVLRALDNQLTFIDNFQARVLGPIVTPGTANAAFTVTHNIGRVPTNYIWNVDQNCVVYDNTRSGWTDKVMSLKCSVVSATLYLIVF